MALVSDGFRLTVNLVDNGRKTISKRYQLRGTIYADAATDATAILGDLNGVTDLAISGYNLSEVFVEDALTIPTALNAQAENIAKVVIQLATSPLKKATLEIPGPADTLFVGAPGTANYDVVDTADALLAAYVEEFETTGSVYISDGEDSAATNAIISGARVHRRTSLSNPG